MRRFPATFMSNLIIKHCNLSFTYRRARFAQSLLENADKVFVGSGKVNWEEELGGGGKKGKKKRKGKEEGNKKGKKEGGRKKKKERKKGKKKKEKREGGGEIKKKEKRKGKKKSYPEPCIYSKAFQSACTSSSLQ